MVGWGKGKRKGREREEKGKRKGREREEGNIPKDVALLGSLLLLLPIPIK